MHGCLGLIVSALPLEGLRNGVTDDIASSGTTRLGTGRVVVHHRVRMRRCDTRLIRGSGSCGDA